MRYREAFAFGSCGPWGTFRMNRGWRRSGAWGGWAAFGPFAGRRRFFESGEVRLAVLSLLKEGPKHGYELIKQFELRSGGLYRASAGTIYPTLQLLEDEGLIVADTVDGKKVYRITKEGEEELERESDTVDQIWGRAERWEEWSQWMGPQTIAIAGPLAHVVKAALRASHGAEESPERQEKLRDILDRMRRELEQLAPPRRSKKD